MTFFAYDRRGSSVRRPSDEQMRALIESVCLPEDEHPDVSLTHESGWSLSAFGSGLLVWENVEQGDGPWHMRGVPPERIFDLWRKLAAGDIQAVRAQRWEQGHGR